MATRLFSLSLHVAAVPTEDTEGLVSKVSLQNFVHDTIENKNYQSVTIPITNQNWTQRWKDMCLTEPGQTEAKKDIENQRVAEAWRAGSSGPLRRDEVNITKIEEAEYITGMAADWLELDSPDVWVRLDSELALKQELAHASYLGIQTVILPPPRYRAHVTDYARAINSCLLGSGISPYTHLSIRIPIYIPTLPSLTSPSPRLHPDAFHPSDSTSSIASTQAPLISDADLNTTWEMWDTIRSICDYNSRLSLTLDLTAPLPSSLHSLSRWAAEPARYIFLPASSFVPNSRGYPVLTKHTQDFLKDMAQHRPSVILANTHASLHATGGPQAYPQYIRHLEKSSPFYKALETPGTVESFAQGYQDFLQAPLQPLMDNLQSSTYETFERDPVKYAKYEEAIFQALSDRPSSSSTVLCVAGAGRGAIVARCLSAMVRSGRKGHIYALEKNPNAYITLQERQEEWGDHVSLVFGDMRIATLPEPADIVVSELLGSFGDNELSPECLDGAMRFLKPDGISIPSSYTAHLAPLSSSKLWNEVCNSSRERKHAETPYVVMFQAVNILSADSPCGGRIQEAWGFIHPRPDLLVDAQGLPMTNTHNVRAAHLTFHVPYAGILHGLAGYFEACLYGDIGLSIHPERQEFVSPNMLSWFPMFFPFKDPIYLPNNAELEVSMWRLTDKRKVWYEWCAEAFLPCGPPAASPSLSLLSPGSVGGTDGLARIKIGQTSLHNAGGGSSWVGL